MDDTVLLRAESELVITEARRQKAERTKSLGSPIELAGKAIDILIEGNAAWIAENTHVAKKIDLETGNVLQIYRGHTAPVTCLAFYKDDQDTRGTRMLLTGSWDKTIKIWNTESKTLLCTINAHDDFVKSVLAIPSVKLLVSSSSDKTIRLWDLGDVAERKTIVPVGSISAHTRPVESLASFVVSSTEVTLFTGDTMGIIKVWKLERESGSQPRWRSTLLDTLNLHRTRVTEIVYGDGQLWTASSDETVQVTYYPPNPSVTKPIPPLVHSLPVRAVLPLGLTPLAEPYAVTAYGDVIRLYDVTGVFEAEVVGEIDAHWHDVTALRLWLRTRRNEAGKTRIEPFIVSASLDGTIRKWRFSELATSTPENPLSPTHPVVISPVPEPKGDAKTSELTEEEERELAELMGDDL
ncbi:WD40-repeat-containing domain protein [Scleroderma citrinum]